MLQTNRPLFLRYSLPVLTIGLALMLQPLSPLVETQAPFLLYFAAIIISAWYGGFIPGLLATFLASLSCDYFYLPPLYSFFSNTSEQNLRLGLFALEGSLISLLSAGLHTAQQRAEANRREAQRQRQILRHSEEQLQSVLSHSNAVVSFKDLQGRYLLVNPCFETAFNLRQAEVLNKTDYDFFSKEIADTLQSNDREALKMGAPGEWEEVIPRPDGTHTYMTVRFPICDLKGIPYAICSIATDITDRKRVEEALHQTRAELELRVEERTAELSQTNVSLTRQIHERLQIEAVLREEADRLSAIIATEQDIATAELDLGRVMNLIAERTQKLTRADGVAIALSDADEMVYRVVHGMVAEHAGLRLKVNASLAGLGFLTGRVLRCDDTTLEDRADVTICRKIGIRSMVVVPLQYERRIVGVLKVLSAKPHAFSDRDIDSLQLMAGFIAVAMIHAGEFAARQAMIAEHTAALIALRESEQRFKGAFQASATGMALIATDGRFLQVNQALCEILGYSQPELLLKDSQSITHPADLDMELRSMSQMLLGELDKYQGEKRCIHKQKQAIWTQFNVSLLRDLEGRPLHFIAQIQDISARKHAEEERAQLIREQAARAIAQAAEQRAAFLASASEVLASSLDYEATLATVARLATPYLADWCMITMLEEGKFLRCLAVVHQDPEKAGLAQALQQRQSYQLDKKNPLLGVLNRGQSELLSEISTDQLKGWVNDDEHLWLIQQLDVQSAMIVPLVARGKTLGLLSFMASGSRQYADKDLVLAEDLGRRAALAVDNARLYQEANELNRMKDEFLATLSHELRTPLNSMLGWARLLRSRKFDAATTARALETIERNAKSQSQLIEDILDVSRITQGKLQLQVYPVNLISVIETALDTARPAAEAKEIQVEATLDPSIGLVLGDFDRLQQVVWNLLSNAIKFTPMGGQVEVYLQRVETSADGEQRIGENSLLTPSPALLSTIPYAQITVRDTGQGIHSDFLPYVFDRFRQADSSITRSYGGLGLGLAIVRHLVELQGGTVHADSLGENQGATFTVMLPLISSQLPGNQLSLENQHQMAADVVMPGIPSLSGLQILVVDDEADARELITTMLKQYGCHIVTVASVAEALWLLSYADRNHSFQPDVLISDIGMPEADGYSLIRQIRTLAMHTSKSIPAIALTAYAREEDQVQAELAGFQRHLSKPVEPGELAKAIAQLTGRTGYGG